MSVSSISPPSSAGHRPLRDRLLPSWLVRYFSRSRASPSAPIASSAIASSTSASGDDADDPQVHPQPSFSATVVVFPSTSSSPDKRPGLRERLSIFKLYRRLSRSLAPSSRGSPPSPVRSVSPEPVLDALQVPPSSATDTGSGPSILPPSSIDVKPEMVAPSFDVLDASASLRGTSTDVSDALTGRASSITAADLAIFVAPLDVADAPAADPMTKLWTEAVAEWQRKTGLDLTDPDAIPLATKGAVMSYIAKMETMENESEKGEWEALRERVDPLARSLEKICDPIGDTFSAAFPPSKIVFAAVGLIVSAYVRTRDDFAQIGDAFEELQFHLQIVEIVADSHPGQVLHDACVQLLTKVLSVLGVVTEMRREGHLRQWLGGIVSQTRPLSEALQNLRLLASSQQQAMAAITLNKVTLLMETIASDKVSQEWIRGCLIDILRATRENHDVGSLTHAEVVANRTALRRIELFMYNQSDKLRRIETFAEYEQIKEWLNYVDSSYRLRKLLDDRAEGTCSWFLDGDVFAALKEGKNKAILLSGKAGSGKSTIIAAAVEALRAHHACDSHSLVLAHVFDSTNASSDQRDLHALLSTLLCQLALNNARCASIISESRKKIMVNGLPTKARMKELFFETIRATSLRAIVVVDALDEANDEDEIISFLQRLAAVSAISVLASRRPFTDSTHSLGSVVAMDNHGENKDIGLMLDIAMSQGGDLAKVQLNRNGVREKLLVGAEGNFRWVTLVIQELKGVAGIPTKVLRRLESLPLSLQALYQRCLDSIRDDDRDDVRRLLLWLVRSEVPLRLNDFAEIMAFDYSHETPIYHASNRPLPEAVTSMVSSMLITVDGGIVRLAHASVHDFLLSLPSESPFFICKATDYTLMARTVLAYLAAIDQMVSLDPNSPLTCTWVYYVRKAGGKFYDDLSKEITSVMIKVAAHPIGTAVANKSLWIAAEVRHCQIAAMLVDNGGVEIGSADANGRTALHIATIKGHLDVVSLLLGRGASVTARDAQQFTPLLAAAYFAQKDVTRMLLDHGAHIEECNDDGFNSLHAAAQQGHLDITCLLLERGASVSARTCHQSTPLILVADHGRKAIVRLLLEQGADVEECAGEGCTPLHLAARGGHAGTAALLLARGASTSAKTKSQLTPLMLAAEYGRENVIGLLLDNGAQIEDREELGWTSLHCSARYEHLGSTHLLLARGACVDARTNNQSTPLRLVAGCGQEDIARLLLDKGACVESCTETGWTSLHIAAQNGHIGTVRLLLERGASTLARTRRQHTPLMIAVSHCREGIVRLLLEQGADVEECDVDGWTPLHFAARRGHLGIAALLLARGASFSAPDKEQVRPLMVAAIRGREDVFQLLLDKGAHVDDRDGEGGTSLLWAADEGHLGIARLLVEQGASISARNKHHATPLIAAARSGREEIVRLLLDQGACIEDCGQQGWTSLHYAAQEGHLGIVRLLLEHGASTSARTEQQATPLTVAACNGCESIVHLLLDKNAHVEECDKQGWTSLHYATQKGHFSIVSLLLARGACVDARSNEQRTPLMVAAEYGREDVARLLLDEGAHIEAKWENNYTSLHFAAREGHLGIITLLLARGASISARTKKRYTPLTLAVDAGREDIVRLLLDQGADIEECEEESWTSLHIAVQESSLRIVDLLLERGASISARTDQQITPLTVSAAHGQENTVSVLLDRGAHIEDSDHDGQSSLSWAAWFGQLGTARLLLQRGANIHTLNVRGQGPLHRAAQKGHIELIEFFVQKGAALEARDKEGRTPLFIAVLYNQESATELLLSEGGDARTRTGDGTTLLDALGRGPQLSEDAERDARIRELLMRAGCTEETERTPSEGGVPQKEVEE